MTLRPLLCRLEEGQRLGNTARYKVRNWPGRDGTDGRSSRPPAINYSLKFCAESITRMSEQPDYNGKEKITMSCGGVVAPEKRKGYHSVGWLVGWLECCLAGGKGEGR